MQVSAKKIQRRIDELSKLRYLDSYTIAAITARRIESENGEPFSVQPGERWGETDAVYDMRFTVQIPAEWRGETLALHLDLSEPPCGWKLATVEGLVAINGQPIHAVDRYHREFILPPDLAEQAMLDVAVRLWSGIDEPFHTLHLVELRWMDPDADRLAHRMRLVLDAVKASNPQSPTHLALLAALDAACLALDFTSPKSPEFSASCRAALAVLDERVAELAVPGGEQDRWQPQVTLTGHAHIDVAWLWRLKHTRMKAANTFSTALYHMDRYPHFVFMQSTPQLYQYVKEDEPELYARIKQQVAAGQWEAEGAMWVEADTNITGGESLARQFLYGQRFFRQEFGYDCKVLWLPDVFGYSAALPQLIKGAGAEYFVTTKISWNDTNRFPHDTFWWQGLDGTRVLAHFITATNNDTDSYYTYNAEAWPGVLARSWKEYRDKTLNRELLVAYGWGDGGGGPTREMVEAAGLQAAPLGRELPAGKPGTVRAFMDRLHTQITDHPEMARWAGELYFEYHRGTYTSQARTKRNNRFAERDLHNAEFLATLALHYTGQPYPKDALDDAWKIVLTHQFHDILPGSSIGPVYEDAEVNYSQVRALTDQATANALHALDRAIDAPAGSLVVFNTAPWERDGLVEIAVDEAQAADVQYQPLADDRALARVSEIPGYGYRAMTGGQHTATQSQLQITPTQITTPFWEIALNVRGQITRIYDKANQREVMRPGDRGNIFQMFEDKPLNFDAWDIDADYQLKMWELADLSSAQVVETGPLRAGLRLEWNYRDRTRIAQTLYVYAHNPRIDFVTEVDWHEQQTLLKTAFPVDITNGRAIAEIQFGNVERPAHRNTSWDQAKFETCGHKWIDLAEGDYGVALLNDCKYGYDIHDRTLRLTLLKGAISPDRHADQGAHQFTYSLWPHQGDWFAGGVHCAAYDLNFPLLARVKGHDRGDLSPALSLVTSDRPNVVVETVKRAEDRDAIVIRVYECANRRGPFTLRLPFAVAEAYETNLLEENPQPVTLGGDGKSIVSAISPYQIKTFVILAR